MIVVDASVVLNAFLDDGELGARARSELGRDPHWVAPEHLAVEVFSAVRGRRLAGKIDEVRALDALAATARAAVETVPVALLYPRMWQLRQNLSAYDAAYVAVAEAHDCSLVTADRGLAAAPDVTCSIVLARDDV